MLERQGYGRLGRLFRYALLFRGTDVHPKTQWGDGLRLPHGATGLVIGSRAVIGRNVTIYNDVTIGRADVWRPFPEDFGGYRIGDEVIVGAGARILAKGSVPLVIGEGSVVGANTVLTHSTDEWGIWAGAPARRVGDRERPGD